MNKSFNYNENDVVKFKVEQDGSDTKKLEVASASIDVSSLGGSNAMPIEPELQAFTINWERSHIAIIKIGRASCRERV